MPGTAAFYRFGDGAGGGGGAFTVDAVTFDGTNDYLTRGSDFTGSADNSKGLFSGWFNFILAANDQYIIRQNNGTFGIRRNTSDNVFVVLADPTFTDALFGESGVTLAGSAWHHVLIAWDMNAVAGARTFQMYIDDADATPSLPLDTGGAFSVDYTATEWSVGSSTSGLDKCQCDMAEVYFAAGQYLDISNSTNRRKFITAGLKPVNLGADGSTPTGSQPTLYLHLDDGETANNFATNAGSGGGMTVTGALATASTSPSD